MHINKSKFLVQQTSVNVIYWTLLYPQKFLQMFLSLAKV